MPGEPGVADQQAQHVGSAAGRSLSLHRDDHPMLGVDRDLSGMHQMRAMPGLVTQLGVRIGL
jgi:hypothetical protein